MYEFDHENHKELWDWLSKNPDKSKKHWPSWKENGGDVENPNEWRCFACESRRGEDSLADCSNDCSDCPLCSTGNTCGDGCLDGLFVKWARARNDLKLRSKYAQQIRDLPLRNDIEIKVKGSDKVMNTVEFKVGDRVRIKKYEDIKTEAFVSEMKALCGETATIREIGDMSSGQLPGVKLSDWSCFGRKDTAWCFDADMIEHVKTDQQKHVSITITSDCKKIVKATCGEHVSIAKCNPDDTFDLQTGIEIAISRLKLPRDAFIPTDGDEYWTLSEEGEPMTFNWEGDFWDKLFLKNGIVFRTEHEALRSRDDIIAECDAAIAKMVAV